MIKTQILEKIIHKGKKGGISLPILAVLVTAALVVGIMLPHTFETSTATAPSKYHCPVVPDTTKHPHGMDEYNLLESDVPVVFGEIPPHLHKTSANGVHPETYVPIIDEGTGLPVSVTWRKRGADLTDSRITNLLFVEKPGENIVDPFYEYFDIYLKGTSAKDVPDFIQAFCEANLPLESRTVSPESQVPLSFRAGDVQWNGTNVPPPDSTYYIFSYEAKGSITYNLITSIDGTVGTLHRGTRTFQVHYIFNSVIKYIGIFDQTTSYSDHDIAYKYTTAKHSSINLTPTISAKRPNLQIQTFILPKINAWAWWQPECKPAVYLYPTQVSNTHVVVQPKGTLSYTAPLYPSGGWQVQAHPDGTIYSGGKTYPYLYYEAKIQDSAIEKPTNGYVESYDNLDSLYKKILPQFGLNTKEANDFVDYWHNILPKSPYYFVGVMTDQAIEQIEPLTITPKPTTVIRVRLYFQPQNTKSSVTPPLIQTPTRNGFTVVEWGGLVKRDANHPFTCSQ